VIAVRTPTGKLDHLAMSVNSTRTFCGLEFHPNVDKVWEIESPRGDDCRSCLSADARRRARQLRLESGLFT
jgi:hypothetical protein